MYSRTKFPLFFPTTKDFAAIVGDVLAIDLRLNVGYFAHYHCQNGEISQVVQKEIRFDDTSDFVEIFNNFSNEIGAKKSWSVSISVPAPVLNGKSKSEHFRWELDVEELKKTLGHQILYILNDLEAKSYSLINVLDSHFDIIHTSKEKSRGNVAILAPGRGLGEAGMFFDGQFLRPFATEGGHTEFSPRTDFEIQFYQFLHRIHNIVAWENVLSTEGLYNIYRFLRDIGSHPEEDWLKEELKTGNFLDVFCKVAADRKSRLVNLSLEMYLEFLAREANNMVLKHKAIGGLIITGDITHKMSNLIDHEKFYKHFMISDKMENLLKNIPIYVFKNPKGIIEGAANYACYA